MQILVPHSDKTAHFVTIDVEYDKFTCSRVTTRNNLSKRLVPLANEVDVLIPNCKIGHGDVLEFHTFIQHAHCSKETALDIVSHVFGSYLDFVEKRRELRAIACSIQN